MNLRPSPVAADVVRQKWPRKGASCGRKGMPPQYRLSRRGAASSMAERIVASSPWDNDARLVSGADAAGRTVLRPVRPARCHCAGRRRSFAGTAQGRRVDRAISQADFRPRSRSRRGHAPGTDRGAPHLRYAVRPHRHPGSDLVDGRRHRPDEQDRQDHRHVRGQEFRAADAGNGRHHRAGGQAVWWRRYRC